MLFSRKGTAPQARLSAYLRRATWGLPPQRRQALWDELEEHILIRSAHLGALGMGQSAALERALTELGPPARLGLGLAGVYLRTPARLGAALLLLGLGLGAGRPPALEVEALEVMVQGPVKPSCARGAVPEVSLLRRVSQGGGVTCYTFRDVRVYQGASLNLNDLERAVRAQGGEAQFLDPRRLALSVDGRRSTVSGTFTRQEQVYTDPALLLAALERGKDVVLEGFQIPVLRVGSVQLRIGDGSDPRVGQNFYQSLLPLLVARLPLPEALLSLETGPFDPPRASHRVQTPLQAGEVLLLLTRRGAGRYRAEVAPVQAGGGVRLYSPERELHFVDDPALLVPGPQNGSSPALLLRLSGVALDHLVEGVFVPARAQSTAQP